jgi:hypothetical protein
MTTTPELSREQRDTAMVERYSDGETLDSIGQSFGITRERVRQIISKVGGTNAEQSRRNRIAAKEATLKAARESFLAQYADLARQMARRGVTRPDAILKLQALYPEIDVDLADDALKSCTIVFDKYQAEDIFSKEVIAAGIWYLLGSELGLPPNFAYAAVHLDLEVVTELRAVLSSAEVSARDTATILGIIGAAQEHVMQNPGVSITRKRYDALREELVGAFGLVSRQGATPWPPTHQTVIKRFHGWNDALEAMGIGTSSVGRSKGLLKFTEAQYADAVSDFCVEMNSKGLKPTVERYDAWAKLEIASGRNRPSGASVRNIYGTWLEAIRSGQK